MTKYKFAQINTHIIKRLTLGFVYRKSETTLSWELGSYKRDWAFRQIRAFKLDFWNECFFSVEGVGCNLSVNDTLM